MLTPDSTVSGTAVADAHTDGNVDNGPQLPVWDRLPHVVYWLLPTAIGFPITVRALRRAAEGSKHRVTM